MSQADVTADADNAVFDLAHVYSRLDLILERLDALSGWAPAAGLSESGHELRDDLDKIARRWDTKLVVALVGPSGAGKSTLMNRVAGRTVSTTGMTRPTTRHVIACATDEQDAAWLQMALSEDSVKVVPSDTAPDGLLFLDTPDTNTLPENRVLLSALLDHVDILVPVFSALNPKLADNIAYLQPYVERIPTDAILPVLTMVDRVPEHELIGDVLPDWRRALETEWGIDRAPAFLVHARGSDGHVVPDEAPLHEVDQFDEWLSALLAATRTSKTASGRRIVQAEKMLALYEQEITAAVDRSAEARGRADRQLGLLASSVDETVQKELVRHGRRPPGEITAALLGLVSQRLWGPIGWVTLLWACGVRLTQALTSVWQRGLGSAWRGQGESRATTHWAEGMAGRLSTALQHALAGAWPPASDALAAAGFTGVRHKPPLDASADELAILCQREAEAALESLARRLSHWLVQVIFNVPILGLAGWVAWDALYGLMVRQVFPEGYLDQVLMALVAMWAISFAIYQVIITLALRRMYHRRLIQRVVSVATAQIVQDHRQVLAQVNALAEEPSLG